MMDGKGGVDRMMTVKMCREFATEVHRACMHSHLRVDLLAPKHHSGIAQRHSVAATWHQSGIALQWYSIEAALHCKAIALV